MFRRIGKKPPYKKIQLQQAVERKREQSMDTLKDRNLTASLDENLQTMKEILGHSSDFVVREFQISQDGVNAAIMFIDGLANSTLIDQFILKALMIDTGKEIDANHIIQYIEKQHIPINEVAESGQLHKTVGAVLAGDTVLFVEGSEKALFLNTKGWEKRGIEEPRTESVVRGPRSGFSESLRTNTSQIRIQLKDPSLVVKNMVIGKRGNTNVAVIYIKDLANPQLIEEVESRLKAINVDAVIDSGYIEQLIEDHHWSPFPTIQNTERPDKVSANLLEGRVVILSDGSPFALIAPAVFTQFYQSPEDYYERFLIATLVRFIRILSMFFAILLPSLYIAFSSFHPEMIPSRLEIAMAAGRSTVPFPSIIEALLMELTMEILREASVRLPGPIGQTIGIVGALVVGQAAVEAGIVSPIMVIVVALTTIGSFASPSYSAAIALRMLRFPMMVAAGAFGLYGIMLFLILIIIHLCSLESFGVPYMTPITPYNRQDNRDTFVRFPLFQLKRRPSFLNPQFQYRAVRNAQEGMKDDQQGSQTGN